MKGRAEYDVVVLGTGFASLCLTRLLLRRRPGISVLTLDTGEGPARKVGESTVEIAAHFLHTRLGLDSILRQTQLPKNGLRFWFDTEDHALSLTEASEDGPITFSYWQSFQLNRETIERTLIDLNREAGADHRFGLEAVRVEEVAPPWPGEPGLGAGDAGATGRLPHRISYVEAGERREVRARWLVDATGMKSLWGRSVGLLEPEERVPHGGCWARFKGFRSPDAFLKERGDRRLLIGKRLLSTNHLMNEGYWIWWIPLACGLMSVGLVFDETVLREPPRNIGEFVSFLRRHRMCVELMEGAEPVDFGRYRRFAFKPRQYFFPNHVAAIGMAGGFIDPFYSGGSDFIAMECECVSELVHRDLEGEAPRPERVEAYNDWIRAFYEQTILFVSGVYRSFASFEVSVPRYRRDLHVYWNLFVWPYFSGEFLDPAFIRRYLPLAAEARERGEFFNRLVQEAYRVLKERGQGRRRNAGGYAFNPLGHELFPYLRFERQMGHPFDLERARRLLDDIDAGTFLALLDALFDGDHSPLRQLLYDAVRGDTLTGVRKLWRERGFGDGFWEEVFRRLSAAASENLARRGMSLPSLEITPASFAGLRSRLEELCDGDGELERRVRDYYLSVPEIESTSHLGAMRERVQPLGSWSFTHTPWEIDGFTMQTVYEFMAGHAGAQVAEYYK